MPSMLLVLNKFCTQEIVIYNLKNFCLHPHTYHRTFKTPGLSEVEREMEVSFFMLMRQLLESI